MKIDFTPSIERPTLSELNEAIIADIKLSFYEKKEWIDKEIDWLKSNGHMEENVSGLDTIIMMSFLGGYNGAYAVKIRTSAVEYNTGDHEIIIDNIAWLQFAPDVLIFKKFSGELHTKHIIISLSNY